MRNYFTLGTEVKLIAFAQISGFDVVVFTEHHEFATCRHNSTDFSNRKFYISKKSGCHFDPILDAKILKQIVPIQNN